MVFSLFIDRRDYVELSCDRVGFLGVEESVVKFILMGIGVLLWFIFVGDFYFSGLNKKEGDKINICKVVIINIIKRSIKCGEFLLFRKVRLSKVWGKLVKVWIMDCC